MIAWNDAFLAEYDSAWGLAQKLSWFNVTSPNVLLQETLGFRQRPIDPGDETIRDFISGDWLPPRDESLGPLRLRGSADVPAALSARCGVATLGARAVDLLSSKVRICPVCIRSGYHSIVHQLEGLLRCPIHAIKLTAQCPHCRHSLGVFGLRSTPDGFLCSACKHSLLDEAVLRASGERMRQQQRGAIAPIVQWLEDLDDMIVAWPRGISLVRAAQHPNEALTNAQAHLWCLTRVRPCPGSESNIAGPLAGICVKHVSPAEDAVGSLDPDALQAKRHAVYAMIESEISEMRRQCAAHRQCLTDANSLLSTYSDYGGSSVRMHPTLCPVGQGFYIWRRRLTAYRKVLESSSNLGWTGDFFESIRFLKEDIRSAFYSCVQSSAFFKIWMRSDVELNRHYLHQWCDADRDPWVCALPMSDVFREEVDLAGSDYYAVSLNDPDLLTDIDCDRGAAMQEHMARMRELSERRWAGIEGVRTQLSCRLANAKC